MPLLCRLHRHQRSASLAWVEGGYVRSVCKRCGTPLVRTEPKVWREIGGRLGQQVDAGRLLT
ncbi:hypothetical protein [Sphingomonas bacterium]|uniref:hypothetical protein n=1 Tax=Sphingomonas bacterium TaxID=1895847 RepID=UPI001575C234|nr:hypothetical protein [Sphingomonas bacterium]